MKILIVDDSEDDRLLLRRALQMTGQHVTMEVNDGSDAVELFQRQHDFDLVITDNRMANTWGIDIIEPLKHICKSVRIWLVSGTLEQEIVDLALSRGAECAIQKTTLPSMLRVAGITKGD